MHTKRVSCRIRMENCAMSNLFVHFLAFICLVVSREKSSKKVNMSNLFRYFFFCSLETMERKCIRENREVWIKREKTCSCLLWPLHEILLNFQIYEEKEQNSRDFFCCCSKNMILHMLRVRCTWMFSFANPTLSLGWSSSIVVYIYFLLRYTNTLSKYNMCNCACISLLSYTYMHKQTSAKGDGFWINMKWKKERCVRFIYIKEMLYDL